MARLRQVWNFITHWTIFLARKARSAISHPRASAYERIIRPLLVKKSKRALQSRGLLDFIEKRPPDAIPPDYADLWYIYKLVRQRKPQTILEFGSGCSTAIFAQALMHNASESNDQGGYLYSMDSSEKWAQVTIASMPENLKALYEVRHSPVEIAIHQGKTVCRHQNIPQVPIDMIYLDSPPLTEDIDSAIDPIDLEKSFLPGFVLLVDGRLLNTVYLRHHLERHYKVQFNRLLVSTTFDLIDYPDSGVGNE